MTTYTTMRTIVSRNSVRSRPRRLRYAVDSPPKVDDSPVPRACNRMEAPTATAMTIWATCRRSMGAPIVRLAPRVDVELPTPDERLTVVDDHTDLARLCRVACPPLVTLQHGGGEVRMPALPLIAWPNVDPLEIDLANDRVEAGLADGREKLTALQEWSAGGVGARPEEEIVDDRLASARDEQPTVL